MNFDHAAVCSMDQNRYNDTLKFVSSYLLLSTNFFVFSVSEKRVACILGKMHSEGIGDFPQQGILRNSGKCAYL